MSDNILTLINSIASGNAVETESAFNAAMADKISAKLEDMRTNVAKTMFATEEEISIEENTPEETE